MDTSNQPIWAQYAIKLPAMPRGCHLISSIVEGQLSDSASI